jgi:hypothetical protein
MTPSHMGASQLPLSWHSHTDSNNLAAFIGETPRHYGQTRLKSVTQCKGETEAVLG